LRLTEGARMGVVTAWPNGRGERHHGLVSTPKHLSPATGFGAVTRGTSTGNLYFGANLEFPGLILQFTVHAAEQSTINNAWLHGESGVTALAVSAAPCGQCRQFLYELRSADELRILTRGPSEPIAKTKLPSLLPRAFGPRQLGVCGAMMEPEQQDFSLKEPVQMRSSDSPLPRRTQAVPRRHLRTRA
jgi:cytidine deaminase